MDILPINLSMKLYSFAVILCCCLPYNKWKYITTIRIIVINFYLSFHFETRWTVSFQQSHRIINFSTFQSIFRCFSLLVGVWLRMNITFLFNMNVAQKCNSETNNEEWRNKASVNSMPWEDIVQWPNQLYYNDTKQRWCFLRYSFVSKLITKWKWKYECWELVRCRWNCFEWKINIYIKL